MSAHVNNPTPTTPTAPTALPAEHAADFLLRFRPAGRVNLAAITPDVAGVEGRNFTLPEETDAMRAWIDARNGSKNLYFCPNEPREDAPHSKLRKEHIGAICAVYTDHDPKGGPAHLSAERERLNKQALELAASTHKPSYLINSGGGVQYLWLLAAPLEVTPESQEAAESQGRGLATALGGGDAVQNIDRLLRLPNTWNLPDAKKLKKGRNKAMARVFATGSRYTLAQLAKYAAPVAAPSASGSNARVALIGFNWSAVTEEISEDLQRKLQAAITTDPTLAGLWAGEKSQGDTSRSGFDASLIAILKRLQFEPTEAAQILHVYPHGKGPDMTARDFERAWLRSPVKTAREDFDAVALPSIPEGVDEIGSPIAELNKKYAFVMLSGGHAILHETTDETGRPTVAFLKEPSFHAKLAANLVQSGKKTEAVTKLWMTDPKRRSYDRICFMPGQTAPAGYYNLACGFSVEPAPALTRDTQTWGTPGARAAVAAWREHLLANVAQGNEERARWVTGWFAHLIQKPWEKPRVALALYGQKGTGKNVLVETVGELLGPQFLITANRRSLEGQFNSHLERCLLLGMDEAFWSEDRRLEGVLKDLITGKSHTIERKGFESFQVRNLTRVVLLGNDRHIVPASADERRYAVFEVGNGRMQDQKFFGAMVDGMAAGGNCLLLRYLLDFDLTTVDINTAPNTAALAEQKHASLDPFQGWWHACLTEGRIVGTEFSSEWPATVEVERFRQAFLRHAKGLNLRWPPSETKQGRLLKQACPGIRRKLARAGEARAYVYQIPFLGECRGAWDKYLDSSTDWNGDDADEAQD